MPKDRVVNGTISKPGNFRVNIKNIILTNCIFIVFNIVRLLWRLIVRIIIICIGPVSLRTINIMNGHV